MLNFTGKEISMYIPASNQMNDRASVIAFMKRFSFATLLTARDEIPVATHLPFVIKVQEERIILASHMAQQNPQHRDITTGQCLVIFQEPHAYISPANYEKELNVPTWNYIAVHAYGTANIITDPAKVKTSLEEMIDSYEPEYRQQWEGLPEKYQSGLIGGLVAFEIEVNDLQAKEKLSQNKTVQEQRNIIQTLSASDDSNARITAEYMKKKLDTGNQSRK